MVNVAREVELDRGETGTGTAVKMPIGNSEYHRECGRDIQTSPRKFYRYWTPVSQPSFGAGDSHGDSHGVALESIPGKCLGRPMVKYLYDKLCL